LVPATACLGLVSAELEACGYSAFGLRTAEDVGGVVGEILSPVGGSTYRELSIFTFG